jgi:hypothetical protein
MPLLRIRDQSLVVLTELAPIATLTFANNFSGRTTAPSLHAMTEHCGRVFEDIA